MARARVSVWVCGYPSSFRLRKLVNFGSALVCVCVCMCVRACVSISVVSAALLTRFGRTMGRMTRKLTRRVLGHSLVRSLIHSHHTLIRFLRTARFARALRCAHSFARSPTRTRAHGKEIFVHELNASISCSFNPLWAARLCVCACVVCVVIAALLTRFGHATGRMTRKLTRILLSPHIHSLIHSPIHSLPSSWERGF